MGLSPAVAQLYKPVYKIQESLAPDTVLAGFDLP